MKENIIADYDRMINQAELTLTKVLFNYYHFYIVFILNFNNK